jgi:carbon monoxide dehydrogenase subunit G
MARYRFLTTWILDAEIARVWDAIYDAERWPEWWPGVERVEVVGDDLWRSTWKSVLPYRLTFEFAIAQRDPPHVLAGKASGELEGTGTWRLFESPRGTAATWDWEVGTTAAWMNALGVAARPAFTWNHGWVMRRGGEGLARHLGCALIASG